MKSRTLPTATAIASTPVTRPKRIAGSGPSRKNAREGSCVARIRVVRNCQHFRPGLASPVGSRALVRGVAGVGAEHEKPLDTTLHFAPFHRTPAEVEIEHCRWVNPPSDRSRTNETVKYARFGSHTSIEMRYQ